MKRSLPVILLAVIFCLLIAPARQLPARQADESNQYALSNGAAIQLSFDWTQRALTHIPPPTALAPSAPPLDFYDFLVFQNAADHSQVEFALSTNPFLGRDAYSLDREMHRPPGMVSYLFYFFFPPPSPCLNGASSAYDKASREAASNSDPGAQASVAIDYDCQYAPALSDFYSSFISGSVTFRCVSTSEYREGALRDLYLLPMTTEEFNGLTFYVFEAQGRRQISLATTDRFNLPDSLQGTQPDFLWAIGAPSPFPFVQDVTRKKALLLHVVYAGVAPGANKKGDFLRILRTVQSFGPKAPDTLGENSLLSFRFGVTVQSSRTSHFAKAGVGRPIITSERCLLGRLPGFLFPLGDRELTISPVSGIGSMNGNQ